MGWSLQPIEALAPGSWLLAYPDRVVRLVDVATTTYRGPLVTLALTNGERLRLTADQRVLCAKRHVPDQSRRDWTARQRAGFVRASELRHDTPFCERRLWSRLRDGQLGTKFRRQHPIGPYIVDFYAFAPGLVIEVDGDTHFGETARRHDDVRTAYLEDRGLTVLRVGNHAVATDLDSVVAWLWHAVDAARPTPWPGLHSRRADCLAAGDRLPGWPAGAVIAEASSTPGMATVCQPALAEIDHIAAATAFLAT